MKLEFVICFAVSTHELWLGNFLEGLALTTVEVSIKHISTNLMIADPLTKQLSPKTFIEHVDRMGIIDIIL